MEQNIATIEKFGKVCERFGVDYAYAKVIPMSKPRDAPGTWIPYSGTLCFTTGREMAVCHGDDRVLRKIAKEIDGLIYPKSAQIGVTAPI